VVFPSGRSSISNICPDDENFPSGCSSVSRNFKLFKIASVRTWWQIVWTLLRVQEESSVQVHPSGRRGNTVQMPFRVWQAIGFLSQTQIWEDSCKPSGQCGVSVRTLSLVRQVVQQKCNRPDARETPSGRGLDMEAFSAILERRLQLIVWTLGQAVRTPFSILIITFCLNIGLAWNWHHWKDNEKIYNLIIQTAKIKVQTRAKNHSDAF
jgi:hypothetical protein